MSYDTNNVFAKILRNEIPCNKITEDKYSLAFHDAFPKSKIHALVIPKGHYISAQDFSENASEEEIVSLVQMIGKVAKELGVDTSGYRILTNHGKDSNQEVPHFHVHICGGENLGPLLAK